MRLLIGIGLALVLAGCAGRHPELSAYLSKEKSGSSAELEDTPFFAQEDYQCGPAALATVLNASGAAVTPEELVDKVYLPERQGSLQVELIAASRRYGRIPYRIEPALAAMLAEVKVGRPVLVLQNLGLKRYPVWHYAVVVGFDIPKDQIILRSGRIKRQSLGISEFLKTWERAERWGLVVLRPGELPATAEPKIFFQALADAEPLLSAPALERSYAAALERWPDSEIALLGLGNAYYGQGAFGKAESAYRQLITKHPDSAVGRNNLAQTLADLGFYEQALAEIDAALETDSSGFRSQLQQTRAEILQSRGASPKRCGSSDGR